MRKKQYQQKHHHDHTAADRSVSVDDAVYLHNTGEEYTSGFLDWWPDRRAQCPMKLESKSLTQYTDAMEISFELESLLNLIQVVLTH